jgi:hypothetical protein
MVPSDLRDGVSEILVSSPYASREHHIDLTTVDESSRQLALVLQSLKPITIEYPTKPYAESFNWQEIVDQLPPSFTGIRLAQPTHRRELLTFGLVCRTILLHRILFHSPPQRRYCPTPLPRRPRPRRSQLIGRPPKILVAGSARPFNTAESCDLSVDELGACETGGKITDAWESYGGDKG